MLRYHGVLAGRSKDRAEVTPDGAETEKTNDPQQGLFEPEPAPPPPSRHPWAWLLKRVFAVDIMTCPRCQSSMRVKSIATETGDIRAVFGMGSRARPPPQPLPVRQLELDFAAA